MVAYRGFRSPCRQYMPAKPTRYGFKFWVAVCVTSAFIWNMIPYLGKGTGEPEPGLAKRVVHKLTVGLQHKGHNVCVDNYFAAPSMFDGLLRRGIFATESVKNGCIGFPSSLCGFKKGEHLRSTIFWAMHSSGQMPASVWYDSKPVAFLSTSSDSTRPAIAKHWLKGVRQEIHTTPHQIEYQSNMHGVDLVDQMRRNCSTQFHSKKWWHKYLMFVVDSVLQNAWVCYCHNRRARGQKKVQRVHFIYDVAFGLIMPKVALPRTCTVWNRVDGGVEPLHGARVPEFQRMEIASYAPPLRTADRFRLLDRVSTAKPKCRLTAPKSTCGFILLFHFSSSA